jgi:hypothetical protein
MSKETCYAWADVTGDVGGGAAGASAAVGSIELGPFAASAIGGGVQAATNYGIDHTGQFVCDALYDPPSELVAVDYYPDTDLVVYGFMDDNSSNVTFESYDISCAPLDEGLCVPADTVADSTPADGGFGED